MSIHLPELHIITETDIIDVQVDVEEVDLILNLNTPDTILQQSYFPEPVIILPDSVPDANSLLDHREQIRLLQYVPNKSPEMYRYYHLPSTQQKILSEVESYFINSNKFAFVNNMYPYTLPPGVAQYIAWMKEMNTQRRDTAEFIAKCIKYLNVNLDIVIIFERPIAKTTVKMIKGSFPVYRHVHVWWQDRNC